MHITVILMILASLIVAPAKARLDETELAYDSLSASTMSARREAFGGFSPEKRAALWRLHLTKALKRNDLTNEQRDLIAGVINAPNLSDHAYLSQLTGEINEIFPKRVGREIFERLGGPEHQHHASITSACSCSQYSDWCATRCGAAICIQSDSGCGTLWMWACTGICKDSFAPEEDDHL